MSYSKLFIVVAAAAICLASTAPASATVLTRGDGTTIGVGSTINFQVEGEHRIIFHPPIGEIECMKSFLGGSIGNAGGSTSTVSGNFSTVSFELCNATVTVLKKGSFEIHTQGSSANGNGTMTMSGQEITVSFAGFHCIFGTNNTDVGSIVGGIATPFLGLGGILPRTGGSSGVFCGSSAQLTGLYEITTTFGLKVD